MLFLYDNKFAVSISNIINPNNLRFLSFSFFLAVPGRIELPSADRQSAVINHYTKRPKFNLSINQQETLYIFSCKCQEPFFKFFGSPIWI